MKPRICMCCGEPIKADTNAHSRNPNMCASCSSLVDGLDPATHKTEPEHSPVYHFEEVQLELSAEELAGWSSSDAHHSRRMA